MGKVVELPDNLIGIEDHEALESFGGSQISRGRLTRFAWDKDSSNDPIFQLFRGGANEELVATIEREREKDEFQAKGPNGKIVIKGKLGHVMAELNNKLATEHGERKN